MRSRYMKRASKPTMTPHKAISVVFSGKDNELTKDAHQVLSLFHSLAIGVSLYGAFEVYFMSANLRKSLIRAVMISENVLPFSSLGTSVTLNLRKGRDNNEIICKFAEIFGENISANRFSISTS